MKNILHIFIVVMDNAITWTTVPQPLNPYFSVTSHRSPTRFLGWARKYSLRYPQGSILGTSLFTFYIIFVNLILFDVTFSGDNITINKTINLIDKETHSFRTVDVQEQNVNTLILLYELTCFRIDKYKIVDIIIGLLNNLSFVTNQNQSS